MIACAMNLDMNMNATRVGLWISFWVTRGGFWNFGLARGGIPGLEDRMGSMGLDMISRYGCHWSNRHVLDTRRCSGGNLNRT